LLGNATAALDIDRSIPIKPPQCYYPLLMGVYLGTISYGMYVWQQSSRGSRGASPAA